MNRISRILLSASFAGAFLLQSACAQTGQEKSGQTQAIVATQEQAMYSQGTKAMDEQRWSDAIASFDRVAAANGQRSDASLYWKAYSLNKLGRTDEAGAVCDTLSKEQPTSPWNRECLILQTRSPIKVAAYSQLAGDMAALKIDMSDMNNQLAFRPFGPVSTFSHTSHPADEDDIKIIALNSLMRQDPEKAVPLLQALLKSNKPTSLRKQALFVLSRSKDPKAQAVLAQAATTKGDPQIQGAAVQYLSLTRGKDVSQALIKVYRESTDAEVKRAAINGLFLTHDAPGLVDLARGEKDLNFKRDIVSQLSLMTDKAAADYMLELLK